MPRLPSRWRRWRLDLASLLLAIALLGVALIEWTRGRDEAQSQDVARRLAVSGAQGALLKIERDLEAVTTLHGLAQIIWRYRIEERDEAAAPVEAQLRSIAAAEHFGVLQVAIIDARGMLAWSTVADWKPVDLADRLHFRVHREGRQTPFISEPLIGRASNRWSLNASRPITTEAGEFAGVAVVSIDLVSFSQELDQLQFAPQASISLLRQDGIVIAQNNSGSPHVGYRLEEGALRALRSAPAGQRRMAGLPGPRLAYVAWQAITDWPLLVTYALDAQAQEREALAGYWRHYLVLLAVLVMSGIGGALLQERRARAEIRLAARRAEAARREITALLDALPGAIYRGIVDAQGDLQRLYFSPSIARITGWPAETFAREGSFTRLMEDPARIARAAFYREAARKGEFATEYRARAASGGWVWVRDHCRVLQRLPDGRAEVVGLISDITAERTLKAQALTTARLATLGEMATGVAHELSQPCADISLSSELAALDLAAATPSRLEAAAQRLQDIAQQTQRMREIIDGFRAFGRKDEGGEEPVDLEIAARRALAIAGGVLAGAHVSITTDIPPALPAVRGRFVAIEQALVSLLLNARDAMEETPSGDRILHLALHAHDDLGYVALTLRDHGHGFSAEALERAFEPFYTTREAGRGTGLGLSIAYGTVRHFGGQILLRNHELGAEVELRLPLAPL